MTVRRRGHDLVLDHVESGLTSGALRVGARLPAERAFAEELGISRASVREGIRMLEAMGMVRTGVGSGPGSGASLIADPTGALSTALRMHAASQSLPVADLVATRVLLESWAVNEAAVHPDEAHLAEARAVLLRMDEPAMDAHAFHRDDAEFHVLLARASGNVVVAAVMAALRHSVEEYVLAAVDQLPDWPVAARRLRREHRAVLAAVEAGDGARAARLITRHIEGFHRRTMAR